MTSNVLSRYLCVLLCASAVDLWGQSLHVSSLRHDFGRVPAGSQVWHPFTVTNNGSRDLSISEVIAACGCTSVIAGKSVLRPGESTLIETSIQVGPREGRVEKSIQFHSNDPENPLTVLTLSADVYRTLYAVPPSVSFQGVPAGTSRTKSFQVRSGQGGIKMLRVETPSLPFVEVSHHSAGEVETIDVRFDAARLRAGLTQGKGEIVITTAEPAGAVLSIPVDWSVVDRRFVVVPDHIEIEAQASTGKQVVVTIARTDEKPFQITGATASVEGISVQLPEPSVHRRTALDAVILVSTGFPQGTHREIVQFQTDDPLEPTFLVVLNLRIGSPPHS